ncbi:hypothetical protein TruAng_002340 [Truncatella angustata]|nr:hypothetical protein TruAng_002340 [Truncatella angustata]
MLFTLVLANLLVPQTVAVPRHHRNHIRARNMSHDKIIWYDEEGGLGVNAGACGEVNHRNQLIVAMNPHQYGYCANPNTAPI